MEGWDGGGYGWRDDPPVTIAKKDPAPQKEAAKPAAAPAGVKAKFPSRQTAPEPAAETLTGSDAVRARWQKSKKKFAAL